MRVTTDLGLEVGDLLRIALPLDASAAPLVLEARVNRTDGDGGMGLEFVNLSESAGEQLEQVLSYLPIGSADPDGDYASLVVSEILNREVGSSAEG